jgi:hypothetical protein
MVITNNIDGITGQELKTIQDEMQTKCFLFIKEFNKKLHKNNHVLSHTSFS